MSRLTVTVRLGDLMDLPAIVSLYNAYIANTAITFDIEPFTFESRRSWFDIFASEGPHQIWVAVQGDNVLGFAASLPFRTKAACSRTVETTIYLREDATGQGIGTLLYTVLFNSISTEDVHRAVAAITLPNEESVSLHERFGFRHAGTMTQIGFKFDRYWDVGWYERGF